MHRLLVVLQLPFVILFIIFEEVIWEGIAEPIYERVKELRLLVRIERTLQTTPRWVILIIFVVTFIVVEAAGVFAGVLLVQGQPMIGMTLYIAKIPIAAFTFWMFRVTKAKLLSYGWFEWLYCKIIALFEWIKSMELYQSTMEKARRVKLYLREQLAALKLRYFSGESSFTARFKRLYYALKKIFKQQEK